MISYNGTVRRPPVAVDLDLVPNALNPGVGAVVEDMVRPLSAIYVTFCGGTFNPIVTAGTDMLTLGNMPRVLVLGLVLEGAKFEPAQHLSHIRFEFARF